jgi:hypothetical protein
MSELVNDLVRLVRKLVRTLLGFRCGELLL